MIWNEEKDVLLCRELLVVEPYNYKEKTKERGQAWSSISDHINPMPGFTVSARAVRERFKLLEGRFKKKNRDEINSTGISPEVTELDTLLEEIISRTDEAARSFENKSAKERNEKELGEHVRLQALETYTETRKRQGDEDLTSKHKKSR